jgi:hypothetical protein
MLGISVEELPLSMHKALAPQKQKQNKTLASGLRELY